MKTKLVYQVSCEYDIDLFLNNIFATEELALEAIQSVDWSPFGETSYEELMEDELLSIEPYNFIEE